MTEGIDEQYRALIASDRVSEVTRRALSERTSSTDSADIFNYTQRETLRAIAVCLLPQKENPIDLAAALEHQLASSGGDGWRYDALPPDAEAYILALNELDAYAAAVYAAPFAKLQQRYQEEALLLVQRGSFVRAQNASTPHALNAKQMALWFNECRAALIGIYMAHPLTLSRIGYSGIADGSDSTALTGFVKVGLNQNEAWEPEGRDPA